MKLIRRLLPFIVLALSILIAVLIFNNKPEAKRKVSPTKTLTVETIKLEARQFPIMIHTQGTVEPRTTTTLIPRVSGEIIQVSPAFRPGGFFEQGETLLTIDPIDYSLAIKSTQATVAEALFTYKEEQAQAEQAADNWKRLGRTTPASDLVLRKPQLARAKAIVDSAKAQLQKAQLDLKRTKIKAPYAGRILEQFVDIGQYVAPGNELIKIFAIDYVEIRLPITEKQRSKLNLPRPYRGEPIKAYQGPEAIIHAAIAGKNYTWTGHVVRTEGSMDRETRQVFVIVQIENPYQRHADNRPPLEIGQFVKADIKGVVLDKAYALPRSAVQSNNIIMIVDKDNRLQRRNIKVIWETQDHLIIQNELAEDEQLCTTYVPFAANNTQVIIAPKPSPQSQETPVTLPN